MKFFKKALLVLALAVSSALCCYADSNATMTVNGAVNPTAISDDAAYTAVFRFMGTATTTTLSNKVAVVQFSNPQDVTQFQNNMQAFGAQMDAASDQLVLAQQYEAQLLLQLTSTGYSELLTYVRSQKTQMAKWGHVYCPQMEIITLYEVIEEEFGAADSNFENYAGASVSGKCSVCQVQGSAALINWFGTNYNGTISGTNETVDKHFANGAVNPLPDTTGSGVVYNATYVFSYATSCTGLIIVSWSTQQELAYTKFLNLGLRAGGGCVTVAGHPVCTYSLTPICSNTSTPDYKWLSGNAAEGAWIRDYYFVAWHSEGGCTRVTWNNGLNHSAWLCQNLVLGTIGASTTLPSGACTYRP